MHLSQFDLFCQVARVKSFSKAAKLLHLSQPAISAQIMAMEKHYGVKLFERNSQGVSLTPHGEVVYNYAKQILELHNSMEHKLSALLDSENQHLVIGATPTIGNHALACSIWTFRDKYPDLRFTLEITSRAEILRNFEANKLDVIIIEGPVEITGKNIIEKIIFQDEIIAIVPAKPPWLNRTSITLQDLRKSRLILREEGSELHHIMDHALAEHGLKYRDLKPITVISNCSAIKAAVEAGHGLSVCCRLTAQKEIHHGVLKALTISDLPCKVTYNLVYRADTLSGAAKKFIRFITSPDELTAC